MSATTRDENERILNLIKARMEIGVQRYGHGLRPNDDTRQWGTQTNSWCEMALEEILDGMVYMAAQIMRVQDTMRLFPSGIENINITSDDIYSDINVLPPRPPNTPEGVPPYGPIGIHNITELERSTCFSPEDNYMNTHLYSQTITDLLPPDFVEDFQDPDNRTTMP